MTKRCRLQPRHKYMLEYKLLTFYDNENDERIGNQSWTISIEMHALLPMPTAHLFVVFHADPFDRIRVFKFILK